MSASQTKQICIEDTNESCYNDLTNALISRGWTKVAFNKSSLAKARRYLQIFRYFLYIN